MSRTEMPEETKDAIRWALDQCKTMEVLGDTITECVLEDGKMNNGLLVDFVRKHFNDNDISYETYDWYDVEPYLDEVLEERE